ncbi:polyprenyl synthetase family protein [Streptomyces olindensis]|uniref:polyprenyl synthetase family protein n=1 Tax=Streptomyces olindensis TaxID=358823 RepID=UPI0034041C4C
MGTATADLRLTERLVDELRTLPALAGEAPRIAEAAGHALLPAGKLLRPLLLVHSAAVVGGDIAQIMPAAAGLECAHVGSLVHDDLVDGDDLRRGRAAVHGKFGFPTALVTGNALFFAWFEALGRCVERGVPHRRVVTAMRIQAETGRQVCEGAALEVAMAGSLVTPVSEYLEMVRLKTAVVTAAACRIGAVLAGATRPRAATLGAFGEAVGLAFQIRDDLLPYADERAAAGKPADSDLRNLRPTLPVLLARDRATAVQRAALAEAFAALPDAGARRRVRTLVERTGALADADRHAREWTAQALGHLHRLPATPHRQALRQLTEDALRPPARRRPAAGRTAARTSALSPPPPTQGRPMPHARTPAPEQHTATSAPEQHTATSALPTDDLALFCPVPLVRHEAPGETIDRAGAEWAVGHGLCAADATVVRSGIGGLLAAGMPFVTTRAAGVMSRYTYWALLLDDHLDTLTAHPAQAIALVGEANRVMYEPAAAPVPADNPWLTSLRDLRGMLDDCLGPEGMNTFRSEHSHWLGGQLWKLAAWHRAEPPGVGEYLRLRWQKSGAATLAACTPPGSGYSLSAADFYDPKVRAFTSALFQACTIVNDLVGMAKEAATGERGINIFSTLAAEHGLDPLAALLKAGELYERVVLVMLRLQQELLADPRPSVARYAAELPQWLPATIDFTATSARYLSEHKPGLAAVPKVTTTPKPVLWDPADLTPPPYPDIAWWWRLLD